MKFRVAALTAAVAVANLGTATAFAPSLSLTQQQQSTHMGGASALNMVATSEVVDGETKPRKTREVCILK